MPGFISPVSLPSWSHPAFPSSELRSFTFIPLDGKAEYLETPDLNVRLQTESLLSVFLFGMF